MTQHVPCMPSGSVSSRQTEPGLATTMIVSSLPKQAVFCSINSVRRHCSGRYWKHEFDNYANVGYADFIPMIRALLPRGDEWFLKVLPPASRTSWGNPFRKACKGAGDIGEGISDPGATEGEWHPQGSRC